MSENNNAHIFLDFHSEAGDDDNSISCKLAMPKEHWEEWKKEFRQVMDETTVPKEIEYYWSLEHHYGDAEYQYNSVEEFLDCFRETEISEAEFNVLVNLLDTTDFKEDLTIAISGCGNTCSQPQIADIGFVGAMIRHEGERVEGYDVLLGGNLEGTSKSRIARKIGVKVPSTGVVDYIEKLINDYKNDNLGQERFKDYLAVLQPVGFVEDSE